MISVIIPLYNKKRTIIKTIQSILSQTYKDLEIIVVDDGSTDNSLDVIVSIAKQFREKIKLFSGNGHHGASWARNYGAHFAMGEYFFFCDADIILRPDALEKLKKALDENKDTAYGYGLFIRGWKMMGSRPFDEKELKKRNYISTMSLIRSKDFPGFDEKLNKFQDWDLWLTMLERGKKGIFVPIILFRSYTDKKGISKWFPRFFYKIPWQKFGIKIKALEDYKKARGIIIRKHKLENINFFNSLK